MDVHCNKKKIGILTHYYGSTNYGGVLQAYALAKVVNKLGYECEQISYEFARKKSKTVAIRLKKAICRYGILGFPQFGIKKIIGKYRIKKYNIQEQIKTRNRAMEYFREKSIPHSKEIYDINSIFNCKNYDVFITGSDQVWRVEDNFVNPGFWLTFVSNGAKKISYAASISMKELPHEIHGEVKKALEDFSAISVREKQDLELLSNITNKEMDVVLDPTLLLDKQGWNDLCEENIYSDTKYVFTYFLGGSMEYRKYAKKIAKKWDCKIINIPYMLNVYSDCDYKYGDIQLSDVSPKLFLSLIRDAEYVLTDSFHATVFSCIFHTNFFVFKRSNDQSKDSMNSRIYNLLSMLKCEERLLVPDKKLKCIEDVSTIDFDKTDEIIKERRAFSISYLEDVLNR